MKESDILYQNGRYWVMKSKGVYYTMKEGITCSESICAFDNYSLAQRYAEYKGNAEKKS